MSEIAGLIREFPIGALLFLFAFLWATERVVTALINRNKPNCNCECCDEDDTLVDAEVCEDDDEEDDDHEPRHGHK
jgi:hypothetical protein